MDESIILYSHLYFKYLQIKLMKEEKVIRVCECTGECAGAGLGAGRFAVPGQHCLTPVTQPLMTVCHCLCSGGISTALMTVSPA